MSVNEHRATSRAIDISNDGSLKLAVAIFFLRSKLLHHNTPPHSEFDALKWKRKANERKQEILRLRDYLKEAEVRLRERSKTTGSSKNWRALGFSDDDQAEQLKASVDFLVELVDNYVFHNCGHRIVAIIVEN
ncbi:hypothetical protein REPUB_Repub03eG0120300 [Reevesia pubescens]